MESEPLLMAIFSKEIHKRDKKLGNSRDPTIYKGDHRKWCLMVKQAQKTLKNNKNYKAGESWMEENLESYKIEKFQGQNIWLYAKI